MTSIHIGNGRECFNARLKNVLEEVKMEEKKKGSTGIGGNQMQCSTALIIENYSQLIQLGYPI
jgi:hypothetical protein